MNFEDGAQFDPGFVQHITAFVPNIEYIYGTLNRYRNFTQKKHQFKMFYPKIVKLLETYLGFYLGCILWAVYIKQLDNKQLLNNLCYGGEYSEQETLGEVDFVREYIDQLQKDTKYYMGQNFSIDIDYEKILTAYRKFLEVNKGFVDTKTTNDIVIPDSFKTPNSEELEEILKTIEKVVEDGKFKELFSLESKVF